MARIISVDKSLIYSLFKYIDANNITNGYSLRGVMKNVALGSVAKKSQDLYQIEMSSWGEIT
jgi:hypothetical protein